MFRQGQSFETNLLQVNLCKKLLFLHQLTHIMTKDCSLNHKFSMYMNIAKL